MGKNFLLGHGENLTSQLRAPRINPSKAHPYDNREYVYARLMPQIKTMSAAISDLPAKFCPQDESVFCIDLHPSYLSKSYFPIKLLNKLNLRSLGSRSISLIPEKGMNKDQLTKCSTLEIFVAGKKNAIELISEHLEDENLFDEFQKIERVRTYSIEERLKGNFSESDIFEIVLHAQFFQDDYIVSSFNQLSKEFNLETTDKYRFYEGGLCFLPLKGTAENLKAIAPYSFLRVARAMPKVRNLSPICREAGISQTVSLSIPEAPLNSPVKVAVLDAGCKVSPALSDWVRFRKLPNKTPLENGYIHGSEVNSALLFGSISSNQPNLKPFAPIDHFCVLYQEDMDDPYQLYGVLTRIQYILLNEKYDYINLSLGPDLPIDDDEVHAWTCVIDACLAKNNTLLTVAAGNNGEADRESGNARVQVPSDSVNALAIGASSDYGDTPTWQRAPYSSFGPGRAPGKIKPDLLAFGGTAEKPFISLFPGKDNSIISTMGTSFAAPAALRLAVGMGVNFPEITPLTAKALLVHHAQNDKTSPVEECGHGCLPQDIESFVTCSDDEVTVLYQGTLIAGKYVKAPIPIPNNLLKGKFSLSATLCFISDINAQDPANYTKSGLKVSLRPSSEKRSGKDSSRPQTKSFFDTKKYATENQLRKDGLKWETVLHGKQHLKASSFRDPFFEIHYMAREGCASTSYDNPIPYTLVVTVKAPKVPNLYATVQNLYQDILQPIEQAVTVPLTV